MLITLKQSYLELHDVFNQILEVQFLLWSYVLAVCISVSSFVVQVFDGFEHDFSYGFTMK